MMKKITPYQYAIFLYEITREKPEVKVKKAVEDFFEMLVGNNELSKIDAIIREFELYEKKQQGIKAVEIISARPLKEEIKKQLNDIIRKACGKSEIKESVDSGLIGGMVLTIEDMMIDGSFKSKLRELNKLLYYGG